MSRLYALVMLLRLGALTGPQIVAASGWPRRSVYRLLGQALDEGLVRIVNVGQRRCWVPAEQFQRIEGEVAC